MIESYFLIAAFLAVCIAIQMQVEYGDAPGPVVLLVSALAGLFWPATLVLLLFHEL